MNWSKAKTLTIIFLLILNAFLGVLVYRDSNKYNLDAKKAKAITDLLEKNSISLSATIPKSYKPLRQLAMSAYEYETEEILMMFFPNLHEIEQIYDIDKEVYAWADKTLTIQNGYISFENPSGTGENDLSKESLTYACDEFLKTMNEDFSSFQLDNIIELGNGYLVQYFQEYKGYFIITNFVEFMVTEEGIIQIDCIYSKPVGFSGNPGEICSPDEALLNVMQRIKSSSKGEEIEISRIDLVYSQEKNSQKAIPVYRVYVDENQDPFFINAYTNTIFGA
ncbi:MAG: two-component system regulatory protein YycI [Clostridiales bacterium]|nr:two-component system regulatory protein YycI [Clostridiales bacterium]